jgi:hypothetical protein
MTKVVFLSLLLAVFCLGQQPSTLAFDTSNMKVSVAPDRQAYLPGENAKITLTVSNLANRRVVSLTQFLSSTSCLLVGLKGGPRRLLKGPVLPMRLNSTNATSFEPGESKLVKRPGTYVLLFRYGASTSEVEYSIATTILEADEVVRLRDGLQHLDGLPSPPFRITLMYSHCARMS